MGSNPFSFLDAKTTTPPPPAAPPATTRPAAGGNPFSFLDVNKPSAAPAAAPQPNTPAPEQASPLAPAKGDNPFSFIDDTSRAEARRAQETKEQLAQHPYKVPFIHSAEWEPLKEDFSKGNYTNALSDLWQNIQTPTFDLHAIDRDLVHGGDESKMMGVERGATDFVSGFSSPLQLALTIGTWGTGTFLEAGGAAALKTAAAVEGAGFAAEDIPTIMRGAKQMAALAKTGEATNMAEAAPFLEKMGIDPKIVSKGLEALRASGMSEESLWRTNLTRRAISAGARYVGKDPISAEKMALGVQSLVNMGFTALMAKTAIIEFPRLQDAINDKDWDKVQRLAVEVGASGLFAGFGLKHLMSEAGSSMEGIKAAAGMQVKPTEENLQLIRHAGIYEREQITAQNEAQLMVEELRKAGLDPEQLSRVMVSQEAGHDPVKMAIQGNHLLEAAGLPDRIKVPLPMEPSKAADDITLLHQAEGGATYSLHSGNMKGQSAFSVGAHPERSLTLDHDPAQAEIQQYIEKNADILHRRDRAVGTYRQPDGQTVLDIVATPPDEATALRLATVGRERPEDSYYDLEHGKVIPVPPSGESLAAQFGTAKKVTDHEASYVLADGRIVGLPAGMTHDAALGAKPTQNARVYFVNKMKILRARFRRGRAGDEVSFSIPIGGVSESQARQMRYAAEHVDRMGIEIADPEAKQYEMIDEPNGAKVMAAINRLGGIRPDSIEELVAAKDPTAMDMGLRDLFRRAFKEHITDEHADAITALMKARANKLNIPFDQFMLEHFKGFERGRGAVSAEELAQLGETTKSGWITPKGKSLLLNPKETHGRAAARYKLGSKGDTTPTDYHQSAQANGNIRVNVSGKSADFETMRSDANSLSRIGEAIARLPEGVEKVRVETYDPQHKMWMGTKEEAFSKFPYTEKQAALPVDLSQYNLTDIERQQLLRGRDRDQRFADNIASMPEGIKEQFVAAAKVGQSMRDWYQRSIAAFEHLTETAPHLFDKSDPAEMTRFSRFVAALSPNQSVRDNLLEAIRSWTKWHEEGRPTDPKYIKAILKGGTFKGRRFRSTLQKDRSAKIPNAIKALTGQDMLTPEKDTYYKTPNFGNALLPGGGNNVVNDVHQAGFFDLTAKDIKTADGYHAMSHIARVAAEELGWEPRQAQAAIWSFWKTLKEVSGEKVGRRPTDMLPFLDDDTIGKRGASFRELMMNDPDVREALAGAGVNLEKLNEGLRAIPTAEPAFTRAEQAAALKSLEPSARRLERQLGIESKPGSTPLFDQVGDSSFDPSTFAQHEEGTLSGEGSGTTHLSNEELARNEVFYKVEKSGRFTFQGKQPDPIAPLKAGESVVAINKLTGEMRHADGDFDTAKKFGPKLVKTVFEQKERGGQIKGTTEFLKDGRAIVRGFQSGDISTLLHEVIHVFRRTLNPDELARAEKIYGVKDGKWTVAQEEKFARDGERQHLDGIVSNRPELQDVFDKMKGWLRDIYKSVANSSLRDSLTDEKRAMWDDIYGIRSRDSNPVGMNDARIRELVNRQVLKSKYSPDEIAKLKRIYDPNLMSDKEKEVGKRLTDFTAQTFEKARQADVLKEAAENYVTHVWDKTEDNPTAQTMLHQMNNTGNFHTNTDMTRERILNSAFEGRLLGMKLKYDNPIALAAHNRAEFGKIIAARRFLERLRGDNVRASDGRPMVALAGNGRVIENDDGSNPAVLVNPNGSRSIRIADKVVAGLRDRGELDKLLKEGKINKLYDKKGNDFYAWDTGTYRSLNHSAFRDWNYAADAKGVNVLVNSDLRVHPAAEEYMRRFLGLDKGLKENAVARQVLKGGTKAKRLMLSLSPFHLIQEGGRALLTGVSPFGMEKIDMEHDPVLQKGVDNGLTSMGKDYHGIEQWYEGLYGGHSGNLIEKVPGIGKLQNHLETFLFEKYIPSLKARAFKHLVERYKEKYPEWTEEKQYQAAAADTNERFGGINYRRMGRSALTQDTARLLTLAPDWLESEIRSMARIFGDEGKVARADMMKFTLYMWAAARVLNYVFTQKGNYHVPFGVAYHDKDGKEKVISIRTLPTDILHAASDPGNFLKGRASPFVRTGVELYSSRDEFGRKLPTHAMWADIARNYLPLSVQSLAKQAGGVAPLTSGTDQLMKAGGLTVHPNRTEAMKTADNLASNHNESGPVDADKMAQHRSVIDFEDKLSARQIAPGDVFSAVESGSLHPNDAKQIMKNYKLIEQARTALPNMDGDVAKLVTRASRLQMKEFMQVWEEATPTEKTALSILLRQKTHQYYKKLAENVSPKERPRDPTYRKLRALFPEEAPW